MGQIFSLNNNNNAEEENEIVQSYRYPPKAGDKVEESLMKVLSKICFSF